MNLIELVETKKALRITHDDDDSTLCIYMATATRMVLDYLGEERAADLVDLDSGGDPTDGQPIRADLKAAAFICVEALYNGDDSEKSRPGGIPYRAETILYRLADPPLA